LIFVCKVVIPAPQIRRFHCVVEFSGALSFEQLSDLAAQMSSSKANVLLVGGGAVGTIAAVNIEAGGLGAVTIVARSNYTQVNDFGYIIESVDHGKLQGWRPTTGALIGSKDLLPSC
jgi:predicted dinucleotide-utilizing enzyme